jgi:large subunit ribosomal protein L21
MYAVIRISGTQHIAREGEVLTVPHQEAEAGQSLRIDEVLLVRTDDKVTVGRPAVAGAYVEAEVVDHPRSKKVSLFKFIRRENYRRKKGHRQQLTRIRVQRIHPGR